MVVSRDRWIEGLGLRFGAANPPAARGGRLALERRVRGERRAGGDARRMSVNSPGTSAALGAHAYVRLRFDDVSEHAVSHLAQALQWHRGSAYEGQFIAQSEPRAGACE